MAELIHEYWEDDGGGWFGRVSKEGDRTLRLIFPDARLVFSLSAASTFEAMQRYQDRLNYGDYVPPEGVENEIFEPCDEAEQQAYLATRNDE